MATCSGILAWKIPWTEEPCGGGGGGEGESPIQGVAKSWTQLSH